MKGFSLELLDSLLGRDCAYLAVRAQVCLLCLKVSLFFLCSFRNEGGRSLGLSDVPGGLRSRNVKVRQSGRVVLCSVLSMLLFQSTSAASSSVFQLTNVLMSKVLTCCWFACDMLGSSCWVGLVRKRGCFLVVIPHVGAEGSHPPASCCRDRVRLMSYSQSFLL